VNEIEKSLIKRIDKNSNSEILIKIATVRFWMMIKDSLIWKI
jgi:hypothetical protein